MFRMNARELKHMARIAEWKEKVGACRSSGKTVGIAGGKTADKKRRAGNIRRSGSSNGGNAGEGAAGC